MKVFPFFSLFSATVVSVLPLASLHAAANASDNANNSTYTTTAYAGLNGGTGFGVNTITTNGTGITGSFIGSAANNADGGSGGGINTNGRSFALTSGGGGRIQDTRSFTAGGPNASTALAAGQTFSLGFDNGPASGSVGLNLLDSAGTSQFTFEYAGGGIYSYAIGSGAQISTGVNYTTGGLNVSFALGTGNTFTLTVTPLSGTGNTISGSLPATATISQFQMFGNDAADGDGRNVNNYDLYFNSVAVSTVPEPGSWLAALVGVGLLAGVRRFRRHRRA